MNTLPADTVGTTSKAKFRGEPLPPVKMFAPNAPEVLEGAYRGFPGVIEMSGSNNILRYKFKSANNLDPFEESKTASAPARPATVLCQFPCATPRDLVKALDRTFACHMEEVTTIAPEM